jgi:hypothetical protein
MKSTILRALFLPGVLTTALSAAEGTGKPSGRSSGQLVMVLEEFDKEHPNGKWDIHQYPGTFEHHVKPDALIMIDQKNLNQHLTRRGLLLDPKRRYAIEALFTIDEPPTAPSPNSFCLNFNIAGPEDSLQSISCWAINVDVQPGKTPKGVMKYMGFVDGRFRQIGQRKVDWSSTRVEYSLRVDVNSDKDGRYKFKAVTVTVMEGDRQRERFEVDYSSFPYQPDFSRPVRIGVNTHGADWTLRNLKVYADRKTTSGERKQPK